MNDELHDTVLRRIVTVNLRQYLMTRSKGDVASVRFLTMFLKGHGVRETRTKFDGTSEEGFSFFKMNYLRLKFNTANVFVIQ